MPPASQQPIEQLIEYGLSLDNVLDILPVTDQQTRYLLGTYTTARSSVLYHTMDLDDEFDLPRIQHALVSLLEQFDMLRTVVIPYKNMFLQIVLRHVNSDSTVFETATDSLDEYPLHLKNRDLLSDLHFGDVVTKIFIDRQTRDQRHRIVIRLSHVQYDGIALEKMWTAFEDSYNSSVCQQCNTFICAPPIQSTTPRQREDVRVLEQAAQGQQSNRAQASNYLSTRICYQPGSGQDTADRHDQLGGLHFRQRAQSSLGIRPRQAGSQDVFGACVNIIPYRIILEQNWTARDLLTAVAAQQLPSTPF